MKVRHLKTGNIYQYVGTAIDCTNGEDDKRMEIYSNGRLTFVREKNEFWNKFEEIEE